MRGLSTTALLLAAVLEGRSFASEGTEITLSAPAGNILTEGLVSTTELIQDTIVDEILQDDFPIHGNEETRLDYEQSYLEYLESMVNEFQREISASQDRLRDMSLQQNPDDIISNCSGSPGCIVKSAFRKSVRFITSLGSGTADANGLFDGPKKPPGKGHWHWPKFPFPHHGNHTHHGHGNHTHGNHTFPPHFPHHGNHTHRNHTHGNHTHPPHHPPFRLPPHFCRPPHHKPPHKKPHHPTTSKDGELPNSWSPQPPFVTAAKDQVYALPVSTHPIHHPLVQITITPAKLLISALLCMIFLRIFHRIRRRRLTRRSASSFCPYAPYQADTSRKARFRDFFLNRLRLFSRLRAPPLSFYHGYGDEKVMARPIYYSDYRDGEEEERAEKEGYLDCGGLDEKQGGEDGCDYGDEKGGEEYVLAVEDELASFRSVADLVCDMVVAAEEGRAGRGGCDLEVGRGGRREEER